MIETTQCCTSHSSKCGRSPGTDRLVAEREKKGNDKERTWYEGGESAGSGGETRERMVEKEGVKRDRGRERGEGDRGEGEGVKETEDERGSERGRGRERGEGERVKETEGERGSERDRGRERE